MTLPICDKEMYTGADKSRETLKQEGRNLKKGGTVCTQKDTHTHLSRMAPSAQ